MSLIEKAFDEVNFDTHTFEFIPILEPCYPNFSNDPDINNIDF